MNSVADFLSVEAIIEIATRTKCTHIHPGYGFLSESPALPRALAKSGIIAFIGPSSEILHISSDKVLCRDFATSLDINIAPGTRVSAAADVSAFAQKVGFPVIIKALDGGGGRGIRVVEEESGVDEAFKRCLGESPSKRVFAEKALTGPGWKHVEVQIIGDGTTVNHLWERECSVQRRFQKIIEMAPSRLPRQTVQPLIDASLKLASHLKYKGLGTFEYLINTQTREWIFLEINPRVQVEHTITEEITDVDLIRAQLLLFTPRTTLSTLHLSGRLSPPTSWAIQLRLTAEDPARALQLSPGQIHASDVSWPAGRGVRIDTWLADGPYINESLAQGKWTVGTDFDSLLAKIVVRDQTFEEATEKARRALRETHVGGEGVKTNVALLAGVIDHQDWASNAIDTLWLERNTIDVLQLGTKAISARSQVKASQATFKADVSSGASLALQPGTLFNLTLIPSTSPSSAATSRTAASKHTLTLSSIAHNAFPSMLSGTLQSSFSSQPLEFSLSQSTSAVVSSGEFEHADLNDPRHVASPMTGKIVDLHAALVAAASGADVAKCTVRRGDVLFVLSVMKMENVVVAPFDGVVERTGKGVRTGVIFGEGMLICVFKDDTSIRGRL